MLPPTESDEPELAFYERAREAAFRTFSEFWVGVSNHFGASPKEIFYYTTLADSTPESLNCIGIGGVQYRFSVNAPSFADRLNGLNYQGTATFRFSVFRHYHGTNGWTPWMDVGRFRNQLSEFFGFAAGWGTELPEGYGDAHQLRFSVEEKDGHWRVKNTIGDFFVNDRHLVKSEKSKVSRIPLPTVQRLIESAPDPRRKDKGIGNDAKKTPLDLGSEVTNTMTLLRGRPL